MYWMIYGVGISAIVILIGGCATPVTDDPSQGGLAGGLYGISSGSYEQRLEERRSELEATRQNQQGVQQEYKRLASDKAQQLRQKQQLQAELTSLQKDTGQLSAQLTQLKSTDTASARKKVELQKRIQQVNTNLEQLKQQAATQDAQVAEYQRKANLLNNEIEQLWEIFHTLE